MPGKPGFKYVYSPGHIDKILAKIQETGRPENLTLAYVKNTWLLKNAQYSAVLDLLREMEFVDDAGVPTERYAEYQNPANAKRALAAGIRSAYPRLFKAYPNACELPRETVSGYVKQHTGAEKAVWTKIVATIMRLCTLADFTAEESPPTPVDLQQIRQPEEFAGPLLPITMNIQIVIPSDASSEQYDKIFSSIKKFLIAKG